MMYVWSNYTRSVYRDQAMDSRLAAASVALTHSVYFKGVVVVCQSGDMDDKKYW